MVANPRQQFVVYVGRKLFQVIKVTTQLPMLQNQSLYLNIRRHVYNFLYVSCKKLE